jgi:hypothetical protein
MKVRCKFVSIMFTALFPAAAWSQSTLNFPLPVDVASKSMVGYAVVNPDRTPALVTFKAYDETGAVTASTSLPAPAGGQIAKLFSELFSTSNANGWVQVTSNVSGLHGFMIGGDFVNNVDGVDNADSSVDQVFPLTAATTTIVIANPMPALVFAEMKFFNAYGIEITPSLQFGIPGHGSLLQPVLDLPFFGQQYADARSIRLTSGGLAAAAMVAQYMISKPEFALYNGVDIKRAGTQLNFPHVVDGELDGVTYRTAIAITNVGPLSQTVTLTFTPESGFGSKSEQLTIAAGGTTRELITFPGSGFQSGWLQVQSPGGVAAVLAVVNADARSAGIAVVEPQTAGSSAMLFAQIANQAPWSTGLAFVNTSQAPTTVEVFAVDPRGTLIGGGAADDQARILLDPGAKTARLLSDLVPETQSLNGGYVFVRTTGNIPILGTEIFTLRKGGPVATVPSAALPITFDSTPGQ